MSIMKDNYISPLCWEILLRAEAIICASGQIRHITEEEDDSDWDNLY